MRILLDKNAVRRWFESILNTNTGTPPTEEQESVLTTLAAFRSQGAEIYITLETYNILTHIIRNPPITRAIIANVEVLFPSEPFRKWLKLLTGTTTLTREDAKILAYGSFGTNISRTILGANRVLTLDKGLEAEFHRNKSGLKERLRVLTRGLPPPYDEAELPETVLIEAE